MRAPPQTKFNKLVGFQHPQKHGTDHKEVWSETSHILFLASVFCCAPSLVPSLFLPRPQLPGFVEAASQREPAKSKAFLLPSAAAVRHLDRSLTNLVKIVFCPLSPTHNLNIAQLRMRISIVSGRWPG